MTKSTYSLDGLAKAQKEDRENLARHKATKRKKEFDLTGARGTQFVDYETRKYGPRDLQ